MSVLTKVGSFAKANVTGSQAITGVGFTPKAIIFWTAGSTAASGTFDNHVGACIGFTAGSANSYACSYASVDFTTGPSDTAHRMAAKAITIVRWDLAVDECDLTSFDSDGFTLNWTNQGWAVAKQICYLAIGGTDITNAKVVNWLTPIAAGNNSVTGVGFSPDLVLHAHAATAGTLPVSSTIGYLSFGMLNKHGQQAADSVTAADAVTPTNTSRWQQTDECFHAVAPGELIMEHGHYGSIDSDGFTTYFSSTDLANYNVASLCLKGLSSKIGAFVKPTATAPVAQSITRLGFTPRAVLFTDTIDVPTGPQIWASWEMGAYDGTTQRLAAFVDVDGQTTTNAKSAWFNNAVALGRDSTTTTSQGAATSLDADGFSLNWTPNDGNATETLYLAIGDAGVNTFPSKVA